MKECRERAKVVLHCGALNSMMGPVVLSPMYVNLAPNSDAVGCSRKHHSDC
jgi:hypothetical protein